MVFGKQITKNFQDKDYLPEQYSRCLYLFEVYKTDEENWEKYTPKSSSETEETKEPVETTEEKTDDETDEEEEEDDEDSEENKFKLHQGEILEKYYYTELTGMEVSHDYTDISTTGSVSIPYYDTDLSQCYLGVRTLLRQDWEAYDEHKPLKSLAEAHLGFITEQSFTDELTKISLSGMTKLLEQKYEFNFTQMKRSEIIIEVIKTAGLKADVNAEGLLDEVIDYTNVSSDSSDDDSVYSGDVPADVAELAKKICKGKKDCMSKIKAIWAWEVQNVHYKMYNNSPTNNWDASKCLQNRNGINCCDTACLTVHLLRAVGVKANYVYNSAHCWTVAYCGSRKIYMDKTSDSPPRGVISGLGQVWKGMTGTEGEKAYGGYG